MLSETAFRYLIHIYETRGTEKPITPKTLGEEMHVQRPTAYEFIKKLVNEGYLEKKEREYYLTEKGRSTARDMLRRHRIIETLLYRNGVEIGAACRLATKIQRDIDTASVNRIYDSLGHPKCCPHGKPIPGD